MVNMFSNIMRTYRRKLNIINQPHTHSYTILFIRLKKDITSKCNFCALKRPAIALLHHIHTYFEHRVFICVIRVKKLKACDCCKYIFSI